MKWPCLLAVLALSLLGRELSAQCQLEATLAGDPMLCPGGTAILSTQSFDSYQWYRLPWGASQAEPIPGAIFQEISLDESDVLTRIFVQVSQDTCLARSDTFLIDSWIFLLPAVSTEGDYQFDPQGHFVVCRGETMIMTLLPPYETNISWFRDGLPLAGANTNTLEVTEPGGYTVEGAPGVCPDYIQPLGLVLQVYVEDCSSAIAPLPGFLDGRIWPNPTAGVVQLALPPGQQGGEWLLYDLQGRERGRLTAGANQEEWRLPADLTAGMYILAWAKEGIKMSAGRVVYRP